MGHMTQKHATKLLKKKGGQAIIPPQKNACLWPESGAAHPRNQAVTEIEKKGRKEWKQDIGYHVRSLVETTMYRIKTIFTGKFKSRLIDNQKLESRLICNILNKLIAIAKPKYFNELLDVF